MFLAACEGCLDKRNDHSRLVRLQTYYLLCVAGAKVRRPEDLWLLEGEQEREVDTFTWGTPDEMATMRAAIEKAHGIKLGSN